MDTEEDNLLRFPDTNGLSVDQKIKVLEIGYKQFGSELEYAENLEHRVTVIVSSVVVILAGLVVQQKIESNPTVTILITSICIGFAILASMFLKTLGRRKQLLYSGLLRIEQIFGLFTPNNFVTEKYVESQQGIPHSESTVFATEGLHSGYSGIDENTKWHIRAVRFAGVVSAAIILAQNFL